MIWRDEWNAVAARIEGLVAAATFLSQTLLIDKNDPQTICHDVRKQAEEIVGLLRTLATKYRKQMPASVSAAIDVFFSGQAKKITSDMYAKVEELRVGPSSLAFLKCQIDYLLADLSAVTRRRSDRAFLHLQRSILADSDINDKWQRAFDTRYEPNCEKLGAAHLLLHGIYAFKITSEHERTDLFFNDRPLDELNLSAIVDAFVLTEWKCIYERDDYRSKAAQARTQSDLYTAGVAAGMELTDRRYIILVSQEDIPELSRLDSIDNRVEYKHLNIVINPGSPSERAKRAKPVQLRRDS